MSCHPATGGGGAPHLVIVAMTANALSSDRDHRLAAGMDDYLSKPISLESLSTTLVRVAREHGLRGSPVDSAQHEHHHQRSQ